MSAWASKWHVDGLVVVSERTLEVHEMSYVVQRYRKLEIDGGVLGDGTLYQVKRATR